MTDAFVNVVVDPGAATRAAERIAEIDQVSSTHLITGEYDIVAQLDVGRTEEIPEVVAEEIHGVTGVLDTVTNVAFEP